jgi:dCTP deaminase
MIKNDAWITEMAKQGMVKPFEPSLIREMEYGHVDDPKFRKVISYGVAGFSLDIRLSPKEFFVFRHLPGHIINPKRFDARSLEPVELQSDEDGDFFVLPARTYGLGVAYERLHMPDDTIAICLGKSTYCRCGIIVNVSPAEPGWQGHLTLEFSNSSDEDCRIFANEGIAALIFLQGDRCNTNYADRAGKYQNQGEVVVLAKP